MTLLVKDPIDALVGQNVKIIRMKRAMTQTRLADLLGITFQQVQKYEKGSNRIGASRLWHIASHLGCVVDDLYDGMESIDDDAIEPTWGDTKQGIEHCHDMARLDETTQKAVRRFIRALGIETGE